MKIIALALTIVIVIAIGMTKFSRQGVSMPLSSTIQDTQPDDTLPKAYLGGGCFWCLESQIRAVEGVLYTRVGYQGGKTNTPTYRDITSGRTGHAEVVEITYDPQTITYDELVTFFLTQGHDATQVNRQGVDVGTQYRSIIFYQDDKEKNIAEDAISKVNQSNYYGKKPIATELAPLNDNPFWVAEDYHQQYYEKYEDTNGKQHIRVLLKEKRTSF